MSERKFTAAECQEYYGANPPAWRFWVPLVIIFLIGIGIGYFVAPSPAPCPTCVNPVESLLEEAETAMTVFNTNNNQQLEIVVTYPALVVVIHDPMNAACLDELWLTVEGQHVNFLLTEKPYSC